MMTTDDELTLTPEEENHPTASRSGFVQADPADTREFDTSQKILMR